MGDAVLADDHSAVGEGGGDVMREVGIDGWNDAHHVRGNTADAAQEIDSALETATKEPRAGQEEVADASRGEVERGGGRAGSFENLQVQKVEERADEFLFGGHDNPPKVRSAVHDRVPFRMGGDCIRW